MLPPDVVEKITKMVDKLFDDLKGRYLGPEAVGKRMIVGYMRDFSLPGIYQEALVTEGGKFDEEILKALVSSAGNYIDSHREKAKAEVVRAITAFLTKQRVSGSVDSDKLFEEMTKELDKQWTKVTHSVERVIDTEASQARGAGLLSGVIEAAIDAGDPDPVVYWVVSKDSRTCDECKRLHLMPDGITPRLWYLSEVSHAYHVKGENFPSIGGLHPHCFTGSMYLHTSEGQISFKDLYNKQKEVDVWVSNKVTRKDGKISFNREASGTRLLKASKVYDTGVQPCYWIRLTTGHTVEVSYGHEMWAYQGQGFKKIRAKDLMPGDTIPLLSGEAQVARIESIGEQQTYCLTEPVTNTLTVNGIVTGNCRCSLTVLRNGFGFNDRGRPTWKGKDHKEIEHQRGLAKAELEFTLDGPSHEEVCESCKTFEGIDLRSPLEKKK